VRRQTNAGIADGCCYVFKTSKSHLHGFDSYSLPDCSSSVSGLLWAFLEHFASRSSRQTGRLGLSVPLSSLLRVRRGQLYVRMPKLGFYELSFLSVLVGNVNFRCVANVLHMTVWYSERDDEYCARGEVTSNSIDNDVNNSPLN
jgi:hypothetical protein